MLQVLLDLHSVKGVLGHKQLQHSCLERPIVLVVLVVVEHQHQVEQQLSAAGSECLQAADQLQQALGHKQHAVVACILVQHHPLLALGIAALVLVLEVAVCAQLCSTQSVASLSSSL